MHEAPRARAQALCNNVLENRVDSKKLCELTRRPEPRGAYDIGTSALLPSSRSARHRARSLSPCVRVRARALTCARTQTRAGTWSDILNIGGFSDAVFSVVAAFLSGAAGRGSNA